MNRGEYGDRRRYDASEQDPPDNFEDEAVSRQRGAGADPRWQAGARQPANGWSTSPRSPRAPRRGARTEAPEVSAPPAPRDPNWRSRRDWHQGGGSGYGYGDGDGRERLLRTQREEWGASRAPRDTGQGEHGYVPFAGAAQWEPMDFGRPEHAAGQRQASGPKGYHRPDERIQDEVCERLARSWFDVSEVEVAVADGIVTLSGKVRERGQKYRIEEVVDTVFGVRDVDNRIRVGPGSAPTQDAT